jgi:hypothetical protein
MIFILSISGCSPSIEDAKKLGFNSVEEMNDLKSKGFKTKIEFKNSEAIKLGFSNSTEKDWADAAGAKTKAEYDLHLQDVAARAIGFENAKQRQEAIAKGYGTSKGYKAYLIFEKIKDENWTKIFVKNKILEVKGGLEIEKNWFSNDQLVVKKGASYFSSSNFFIAKNSIVKIDDDIKEAVFKEHDVEKLNSNYTATTYQFNCANNTYRQVNRIDIKSNLSEEKREIDQATGKVKTRIIPSSTEMGSYNLDLSNWNSIDEVDVFIDKKVIARYREAACNMDLSIKESTQYQSN